MFWPTGVLSQSAIQYSLVMTVRGQDEVTVVNLMKRALHSLGQGVSVRDSVWILAKPLWFHLLIYCNHWRPYVWVVLFCREKNYGHLRLFGLVTKYTTCMGMPGAILSHSCPRSPAKSSPTDLPCYENCSADPKDW